MASVTAMFIKSTDIIKDFAIIDWRDSKDFVMQKNKYSLKPLNS